MSGTIVAEGGDEMDRYDEVIFCDDCGCEMLPGDDPPYYPHPLGLEWMRCELCGSEEWR